MLPEQRVVETAPAPLPASSDPQTATSESLTLSFSEALPLSGVSRNTLYSMVKAGKVPGARKLGGTWRFYRAKFLAWLGDSDS